MLAQVVGHLVVGRFERIRHALHILLIAVAAIERPCIRIRRFGIASSKQLLIRALDEPVPERAHAFCIALDEPVRLIPMRVGHDGDQAVRPIQVAGGDFGRGVAQVGRRVVDVRVERRGGGERTGAERYPHHRAIGRRHIRADLNRHHMAGAVHADRTVTVARFRRAGRAVRVVRRAFEVRGQQEINVFEAHLVFRHAAPRDVVGFGRVAGGRRIPVLAGVEAALHVPGTRRVVDMVLRRRGAEGLARVETGGKGNGCSESGAMRVTAVGRDRRSHCAVEVMRGHELAQVGAA